MCGSPALGMVVLTLLTVGAPPPQPGASQTTVPALTELLKHERWEVKFFAAEALGSMGPAARGAVKALIKISQGECEEAKVRASALNALGQMGPDASEAVPVLPLLLQDGNWLVRQSAAEALKRLGRGQPSELFKKLPRIRAFLQNLAARAGNQRFSQAFKRLGQGPGDELQKKVVPELDRLLQHDRYDVRRLSTEVLGSIASDSRDAIAAAGDVIGAIESNKPPDPAIATENMDVLKLKESLQRTTDRIEAALIRELSNTEPGVRISSAGTLTRLSPQKAALEIAGLLDSKANLDTLWRVYREAVRRIASLLDREAHRRVRGAFAEALGGIGADAQVAKEKALAEEAAKVKAAEEKAAKERAAEEKAAKEKAAKEKAAEEKAAEEKAPEDRAAKEKAAKDKAAKEEADKVKAAKDKAAKEEADKVKAAKEREAERTAPLKKAADETTHEAVAALMKLLDHSDRSTRESAVKALGEIGPAVGDADAEAVKKLKDLLLHDNAVSVKAAVLRAIKKIAGAPDPR